MKEIGASTRLKNQIDEGLELQRASIDE